MKRKLIFSVVVIAFISISTYSYINLSSQVVQSVTEGSINDKENINHKEIKEINVEGNYYNLSDSNELESISDIILVATPTQPFLDRKHENRFSDDGSLEDYFTRTEVKINKVLKNDSDLNLKMGELFEIVEPAVGLITNSFGELIKITTGPYNELQKDGEYLIFLTKNDFNDYAVSYNTLGKYNIDDTDIIDANVGLYDHEYESWKTKKQNYKKHFKNKYGL
ncbi:hypothetical protein ACWE42_05670 [Sutcliffiella cohnii]